MWQAKIEIGTDQRFIIIDASNDIIHSIVIPIQMDGITHYNRHTVLVEKANRKAWNEVVGQLNRHNDKVKFGL